jgi:hypothetical protein
LRFGYIPIGSDAATDATFSNIAVYFKAGVKTEIVNIDPEAPPIPVSYYAIPSSDAYTLGVQFRLEDEESSQGVVAAPGNPNGSFGGVGNYQTSIVLRLEDAPDPPALKNRPLNKSCPSSNLKLS